MLFAPSFLDEIRFRIPLTRVVGRKTKLIRAGREWKACCPFHNERTPSFTINEEKGFYHCFGCGAHGDVIHFLCETEGLSFPEAVKQLAFDAGLDLPEETPESRLLADRAATLHDVMERACAWFEATLQGPGGSDARDYLKHRGVMPQTSQRFRLGYAPAQRTALTQAITQAGIDLSLLIEAGLVISLDGKEPYDRFRSRIMFPIRNAKGKVIAFGGRIIGPGEPKYLNSPETPLFDKGRTLYNLDHATPVARKSGELYVVEGYMDVLALSQVGIETAVAPLGTALTEAQMDLLWRLVPEPIACFDGDRAGLSAAHRAAHRALPHLVPGRSLRFVTLPQGEDPDSLVRSQGAAGFTRLTEAADPLVERLWQLEAGGQDISTPERKAQLRQNLLDLAKKVTNPVVSSLYKAEFLSRYDSLIGRRGASPIALRSQQRILNQQDDFEEKIAAQLLLTAIYHPTILEQQHDLLASLPLTDPRLLGLRNALCTLSAHDAEALDKSWVITTLNTLGWSSAVEALEAQNRLGLRFARPTASDADAKRGFVTAGSWLIQRGALKQQLSEASALAADDEAMFERQQLLRNEIEHMNAQAMGFIRNDSAG